MSGAKYLWFSLIQATILWRDPSRCITWNHIVSWCVSVKYGRTAQMKLLLLRLLN